jgi:NAD(P)-dependent dehydrogenase (short-subunit alcohol dehydrogenase family)
MRIKGKVAVIFGAGTAGNMGQAIARRFAKEGAEVVIIGRSAGPIEALGKDIGAAYCLADITSRQQVLEAGQYALERFGKVDIGVNCTGWGLLAPTETTSEDDLNKICDIQFKGPFYFIQSMLGVMTKGGSIIQISTASSTLLFENHAAYMGTKAGIDHVIRSVANDFGERGIRANTISPGVTTTPMAKVALAMPAVVEAFTRETPLGRLASAEDIAAAALWLADDECFMTGQNLQISGGITLRRYPRYSELGGFSTEARPEAS